MRIISNISVVPLEHRQTCCSIWTGCSTWQHSKCLRRLIFGLWVSSEETSGNNKWVLSLLWNSEFNFSRVLLILLEHLSPSMYPWGILGSTFITTGLEKSHQAQNELYHCKSWPQYSLSTCVVISVCLHVFIIAPAACLRLTCLPATCVKCVWPKKPPCGCVLLCMLAACVWTSGAEPLPTLAICQRPCSAPCKESRRESVEQK